MRGRGSLPSAPTAPLDTAFRHSSTGAQAGAPLGERVECIEASTLAPDDFIKQRKYIYPGGSYCMKRKSIIFILLATVSAWAIDGPEILKKMDVNRTWKSIVSTAKMEIIIDDEIRVKTMEISSLADGNRSLVRFTNPEDEGTKYLMLGDDLWIYFPEENDVVKISGHMLKEGMMGSDVSYEDALEADKLSAKYDVAVTGEERLDGNDCYLLTLTAKVKDAPYYKRVMWVDKSRFIAWKEESFAKSGKKLKIGRVLSVKEINKMWYPVKVEMENTLRKNSRTVFTTEKIVSDTPMDEEVFTMRNLRR